MSRGRSRARGRASNKPSQNITGSNAHNVFTEQSVKFSSLARLITRDMNNNPGTKTFFKYTKDQINTYLGNPYQYEKQLRNAVIYIYGASSHFRRIIDYFARLTDFAYIVSPYKIDPKTANAKTVNRNYRKCLNTLSSMNIKSQFVPILIKCLREDVAYVTMWTTNDSTIFHILPSDYCSISTVEGGVPNVTFDFSYFSTNRQMLQFYPPEFELKYKQYQKNNRENWIELDSPTSFAIKVNKDILDYALPPFAGVLRSIYDLEQYRDLKLDKTALENYALLCMELPMDDNGNFMLNFETAKQFWKNLDSVMPEEVGSVLSPMKISKIGFEKSNTGDTDTIDSAEQDIFTTAGVSSLLFNNEKASANALLLSIKADQAATFGIVKSIEDAINRYIQSQSYGKNFKITFLNCSEYNRKELGDAYLKAASYGLPTISMYAASQGLGQAELDSMSFLEGEVLDLPSMFHPIVSSTQVSKEELSNNSPTDGEAGAPTKDIGEGSDKREANTEAE